MQRATASVLIATAAILVAGQGVVSGVASADTVRPYRVNYGSIDIYTTADHYVGVTVNNLKIITDQPNCIIAAQNPSNLNEDFTAHMPLTPDGSGVAFVGPLHDGKWQFNMYCDGRTPSMGFVGAPPYTTSPLFTGSFDDMAGATIVTIDGKATRPQTYGGLNTLPQAPDFDPAPLKTPPPGFVDIDSNYAGDNVPTTCSDSIKQTYANYNVSGAVLDNALALLDKKGTEETAQQICALTASDPVQAARALCRAGKAAIPADWAYAAIAKLGQTLHQDAVQQFGQSAKDSWSQQCEGVLS